MVPSTDLCVAVGFLLWANPKCVAAGVGEDGNRSEQRGGADDIDVSPEGGIKLNLQWLLDPCTGDADNSTSDADSDLQSFP
ncbi:hypothetical protein L1987_80613 [Smallanthus sonchifolius]|uniref:Uncharacterized protein n=1 Tax=Smallanthus sonchifolius TaxID=185202 RepID=A0ACB8YNC4_9ASTR|nr:hypothetical protein L1987_80613 [Smallanthus sonchifolius]